LECFANRSFLQKARLVTRRRGALSLPSISSPAKKAWDSPLGSFIPDQHTGTITLGGPIATAGGLVFSAATMDNKIYAFDSDTGAELWSFELPAGGQATPMTYALNGKQYLLIAAGATANSTPNKATPSSPSPSPSPDFCSVHFSVRHRCPHLD